MRWPHPIRRLIHLIDVLVGEDVPILAGAIAYAATLSLFPLLIALIALLSRIVALEDAQLAIVATLHPYLPPAVLGLVRDSVAAALEARGPVGLLATLVLLSAASAVAGTLRYSLNRVLQLPNARGYWREKALELVMVVLVGTLIILSVLISGAVEALPALSPVARFALGSGIARVLATVGPWIFSAAAFAVVYWFVPNGRVHAWSLLLGTVTGVVLFEATKEGFFWYLRTPTTYPAVYGHLSGIVIFLIWIYLVALIVLVGAGVMRLMEGNGLHWQDGHEKNRLKASVRLPRGVHHKVDDIR